MTSKRHSKKAKALHDDKTRITRTQLSTSAPRLGRTFSLGSPDASAGIFYPEQLNLITSSVFAVGFEYRYCTSATSTALKKINVFNPIIARASSSFLCNRIIILLFNSRALVC